MSDYSTLSRRASRLAWQSSAALVALTAFSGPAWAQAAEETGANDIVVTAQRKTESIQDVPIAITAVSGEAMKTQNIRGVEQLLALAPNVSFASNGSRDRKELSLRGVSNQINPYASARSSSYAFYIDEFNVVVGTSNPEILDLERVEVLRGPQGTYFGRNAVAGAINISTRKPVDEWQGEVEFGYASFNTFKAGMVLNVPVVPGLLAVRASGQHERSDGWIKNINPIGGGNDSDFTGGRVQARLTPTENLTVDATYSRTSETTGMRVGVPTGFLTATWRNVYYQNRPGNVADPDGVGFYPDNRDRVNFNRPQEVGTRFEYWSVRANYDFDTFSVTAVGGRLNSNLFNYGDIDGGSRDQFYEVLNLRRTSKSGELRLQSTAKGFLEWSIGGNVGEDTGNIAQNTYHGAQSPQGRANGFEATGNFGDASAKYYAIFGQATANFTDTLKLSLGGRYSHEKVRNYNLNRSSGLITDTNDRSVSFSDFSPRGTLSFQPNPNALAYVTVSKGFKSGGTQSSGNTTVVGNEFRPETLWNYEAGLKLDLFDRKVRFDSTVFYMDWKDVQQNTFFQFIDAAGAIRRIAGVTNAASARSYGAEASIDWSVTDQLRLSAQGGYNKANFRDFKNAYIDGQFIDASGKQLVTAPKWTFGAQGQYTQPLNETYDGFLRLEWSHKSSQLNSLYGLRYETFPFISPAYNVVNARVGLQGNGFSLTLYAENLFDEEYFSNAYEKSFYSGVQVEPSYRSFGVSFRKTFN
ncbi:MAG: TonB-dependent receptor [Sphingomonadales bacterium]|nr:MAG: TonB-dependent receptor [Sphingomonadales bacterium]